jgi:hypothetical protein
MLVLAAVEGALVPTWLSPRAPEVLDHLVSVAVEAQATQLLMAQPVLTVVAVVAIALTRLLTAVQAVEETLTAQLAVQAVQVSASLSIGVKMAHFAKIENGIVTEVVVVDNSEESRGEEFLNSLGLEGRWVQTSYNANFGKKFAAIGDTFVASTGQFKPAKPFASWKWNADEWNWSAPKPMPQGAFIWNEELLDWVAI